MLTILIVDDEKIEREGIRFLLNREEGTFRILQAGNGEDALDLLKEESVDILFTDVKMPGMTGIELAGKARELDPELEMVICSGYGDFAFAKEAMRYGVSDYVLKPVDPVEFHAAFLRVMEAIQQRNEKKQEDNTTKGHLRNYFLLNYLYTGKGEFLEKSGLLSVKQGHGTIRFHRMILTNSDTAFFELDEKPFMEALTEHLNRRLYYLNLNAFEAVFFVQERYSDGRNIAEQLYRFFQSSYQVECCFAVSRELTVYEALPEEFSQMEQLLGERFYQPGRHVYLNGEAEATVEITEEMENEILQNISENIHYKDLNRLHQNFELLKAKYGSSQKFSEMYVKFVFSNILKEIYDVIPDAEETALAREIDDLYHCRTIEEVLTIVERAIEKLECYVEENERGSRKEISEVKNYVYYHYGENLNTEMLAGMVYLSPGYLSSVFKEETGVNLNRFIRDVRMAKAKELLETTSMKITQIAREVGFSNNSYFGRSFREYFGCTPESCRHKEESA